jgi:hypothetical protein
MLATRFTELVGCSSPIQQAGMGAVGLARVGGSGFGGWRPGHARNGTTRWRNPPGPPMTAGPSDDAHVAAVWDQLHRHPKRPSGRRARRF